MKNLPALKAAFFAMAGVAAGRSLPHCEYVFFALSAALLLFLSVNLLFRKNPGLTSAAAAYAGVALAFAFSMSSRLSSLQSSDISSFRFFSGTIDESPRDTSTSSYIMSDCYAYDTSWRKIPAEIVVTARYPAHFESGDRIAFAGRAGTVSDARNPGEFDLKSYYTLVGIAGRVYLRDEGDLIRLEHNPGFGLKRSVVEPIRDFLRERIRTFLPGQIAELARGIVLGERMGISRRVNEEFINTGTVHVLSVSGLHVGFFTGILVALAALLRIPRRLRFAVIAPILLLYLLVIGPAASIVRAVIMAVVVLFGAFLQRKAQILNSLGFAALIILVFDPGQFFSPGFRLSFAAVASIAIFHGRSMLLVRKAFPSLDDRPFLYSVASLTALTMSATLGTVPLTAFYFEKISLVSILANLFIVPLSGLFLSLSFTFLIASVFSTFVAGILASAAQLIGFSTLWINSALGSLSFSSVRIAESGTVFALAYFGWLIAVAAFGRDSLWKKSVIAVLLGADILLFGSLLPQKPSLKLFVLDVGQGDAIFVELPGGRNMLVDSGMRLGRTDAGERVVVPFLRRHGVSAIDYFVVTHLHGDHIGGALSIIKNIEIRNFIYPDQISSSETWNRTLTGVRAAGISARNAVAGKMLDSGSVYRVYILHPNRKYVSSGGRSYRSRLNDGSVVMKISVGRESVLLAGDIEKSAESDILSVYGSFLGSEVLKVGHHGSNTSSSGPFLDSVRPRYAVVSVGAKNSFGHPSPEVLNSMKSRGIGIWRTDSLGAACFVMNCDTTLQVKWK